MEEIITAVKNLINGIYSFKLSIFDEKDEIKALKKCINDLTVILNEKELKAKKTEDDYLWLSEELKARNEEYENYSKLLQMQNIELMEQQQLKSYVQQLRASEQQLKAAEATLQSKVIELERFNKIMMGREMKMMELKNEVNSLLEKLGEPKKYKTSESVKP